MTEYFRKWYNKIKKLHDGGCLWHRKKENRKQENHSSQAKRKKRKKIRRKKVKDYEATPYQFKGTEEQVVIDTLAKFGHVYDSTYVVYDSKSELLTLIYVESEFMHGFLLFAENAYKAIPLTEMEG